MPKISIIVPVYKVEAYLPRCVDSILAQTFTDFELILVDDGSPDNCGKICDEYARKDKRICVIHKENGGVSSARNAGLDYAQGEYIMFCDSDDTVDSGWCQYLHHIIEKGGVVLGICAYNDVTECGEHIKKVTLTENKRIPVRDFYVIYRMTCALWNKIFIRETIWKNRIRFIGDISYGEDARFVQQYLRSCKENEWLLFIDKELYNYRACASGLSHPNFEKYWEQECGLFYYTVETLMILNPDITVFEPQLSENCLRIVEVAIQLLFKSNKRIVDKYQKFKEIISSDVFEKATNSCRITRFNKLHHFLIRHRLIQGLFVYYMICIK